MLRRRGAGPVRWIDAASAAVPGVVLEVPVTVEPRVASAGGTVARARRHDESRKHDPPGALHGAFTKPITPPLGSAITAMFPFSRLGFGAMTILPPAFTARSTVAATSGTRMYGSHAGAWPEFFCCCSTPARATEPFTRYHR